MILDDTHRRFTHATYLVLRRTVSFGQVKQVQEATNYVLVPVMLMLVTFAGAIAVMPRVMPVSAQGSSGQLNAQTQFAVGSTLQITSIYGLETTPSPLTTLNGRSFNYGNYGNHNQTAPNALANQQWNLTSLRNSPTANSSITINVQVTNDTQDGGILWTVQGGSIAYNGTTLTVTSGRGGIGELNRVLTIGNATDTDGNTYRWILDGPSTLYGGTTITSLTGSVTELNQSTMTAPTGPSQGYTEPPVVTLSYIAIVS